MALTLMIHSRAINTNHYTVCLDNSNMWASRLKYLSFSKIVFTSCRWFKPSHGQNLLFIIIHRISKTWQTNRLTMVRTHLLITAHTSSCVGKMLQMSICVITFSCIWKLQNFKTRPTLIFVTHTATLLQSNVESCG